MLTHVWFRKSFLIYSICGFSTKLGRGPLCFLQTHRLTTEGVISPCNGDSCSSTHVSVTLYGLAQSHCLTSSGTHVVHTVSKVWLGGHNGVAGLKDT